MRFFPVGPVSAPAALLLAGSCLFHSAYAGAAVAGDPVLSGGLIRTDRYTLQKLGPSNEQLDPLQAVVQLKLSRSVSTIGDALIELLNGTGYSLNLSSDNTQHINLLESFLKLPIPDIQRQIGPMPLFSALEMVAGKAWSVHPNPLNRTLNLVLSTEFTPAQVRASSSIKSKPSSKTYGLDENLAKGTSYRSYIAFEDGQTSLPSSTALAALRDSIKWITSNNPSNISLTGISHNAHGSGRHDLAIGRAKQVAKLLRKAGITVQPNVLADVKNNSKQHKAGVEISMGGKLITSPLEAAPVLKVSRVGASGQQPITLSRGFVSDLFPELAKRLGYRDGVWNAKNNWINREVTLTASKAEIIKLLSDKFDVCFIETSFDQVIEARNKEGCRE